MILPISPYEFNRTKIMHYIVIVNTCRIFVQSHLFTPFSEAEIRHPIIKSKTKHRYSQIAKKNSSIKVSSHDLILKPLFFIHSKLTIKRLYN